MVGEMKTTNELENLPCSARQEIFSGFAGQSDMDTGDAQEMSSFQDGPVTAGRSFSLFLFL